MGDLQSLRSSYNPGDEVLIQKRQYGDAPAAVLRGKIIRKESAFASVKVERNGGVSYVAVPYAKLQKAPPIAPTAVIEPGGAFRAAKQRVAPASEAVVRSAEPRTRAPHFKADGEVHVAEIVQRSPNGYRASTPPPPPVATGDSLRAVPDAFRNIMASIKSEQPSETTDSKPVAERTASGSASTDTATELAAWLEMGNVIFEQAQRKLAALGSEAKLLRDQASVLEQQAESRDREASALRSNLELLAQFQRQAEATAKLILPTPDERH